MIINIRGTHGSGKSTLVRNFMNEYPIREEIRTHIRRRPWGYICKAEGKTPLYVPGHYETPCGGCDTLPVVDDMYNMIRERARAGNHVLFEGILAQHYALRKFVTLKEFNLLVLVLDTPLEQCVSDTEARRAERGRYTDLKVHTTVYGEYADVFNKLHKIESHGIPIRLLTREQAYAACLELLK